MDIECDVFLHPLYDPVSIGGRHELDIVAVHGLNPTGKKNHAFLTWTGGKDGEILWLRDYLKDKIPNARILLFGYNSNVAFESSKAGVLENAESLLNQLDLKRNDERTRNLPLIFICHSLGGIVTKRALVHSVISRLDDYKAIKDSTFGIVFFGTPHRGGNHAKIGELISSLARFGLRTPKNSNLEALKDSYFAEGLLKDFEMQQEEFHFISFYETENYKKTGGLVVEPASAVLNASKELRLALKADHSTICRFNGRTDIYENHVEPHIVKFATKALVAARELKRRRRKERKAQRKTKAAGVNLAVEVIRLLDIPKRIEQFTKAQSGTWEASKKRSEILRWLSTIQYEDQHRSHVHDIVKGTCEWLLVHPKFRNWRESTGSDILWLRGDPGTGKTKLTSKVIEYCFNQKKNLGSDEAVAYFYCDRNEPSRSRDAAGIFNTILKQLSSKDLGGPLQATIVDEYDVRENRTGTPLAFNLKESIQIIIDITDSYPRTTIIFDGIDEVVETERTRLAVIKGIQTIVKESEGLVKIFFSSRFEADISRQFSSVSSHYITSNDNNEDICLFVKSEVASLISEGELLDGDVADDFEEFICDRITALSQGMFKWADLKIRELCRYVIEEQVEDALNAETSPMGALGALNDIYAQMFKLVQEQPGTNRNMALNLIIIVMAAERPLRREEACALAVADIGVKRCPKFEILLSQCHNLIVYDDVRKVIRFPHLSAREYLETAQVEIFGVQCVQNTAFSLCLRLMIKNATDNTVISEEDMLRLNYALKHWQDHYLNVYPLGMDQENIKLLQTFLGSFKRIGEGFRFLYENYPRRLQDSATTRNLRIVDLPSFSFSKHSPEMILILTATYMGQERIIKELVSTEQWEDFTSRCKASKGLKNTPLTLALRMNHQGIIKMLLKKGDYDVQAGRYSSILDAAISLANFEVAHDLLRKVFFNSLDGPEEATAVRLRESNEDLREHILPLGKSWKISRALVSAAAIGNCKIAEILLVNGADVNYSLKSCPNTLKDDDDYKFDSPLAVAARNGNIDILKLLLDHGAILDYDTGSGCALSAAAYGQSLDAINFLLDRGANINYMDSCYGCPVSASLAGDIHDKIWAFNAAFDLLVERGADLDPPGLEDEHRPIVVAIHLESDIVCERIIESGVDIDLTIGGQSLKQYAASILHWNVLDTLLTLQPGAIFEVQDYGSPLSAALSESIDPDDIWIVKMLIGHGADPNAVGGRYGCPLSAGAWNFNLNSLELLLDNGADVNLEAGVYGCPLTTAVIRGQLEVVKLFLDRGANVNLEGGEHSTPLNAADAFLEWATNHVEEIETGEVIKQLLIDRGAH